MQMIKKINKFSKKKHKKKQKINFELNGRRLLKSLRAYATIQFKGKKSKRKIN